MLTQQAVTKLEEMKLHNICESYVSVTRDDKKDHCSEKICKSELKPKEEFKTSSMKLHEEVV